MKYKSGKLLTIILAGVIALTGCTAPKDPSQAAKKDNENSSSNTAAPTSDSTVTLAIGSTWETYNPFNAGSNYDDIILGQIYDKLVYNNYDGTYEPRLAKSWELSEDNNSMIFTLQDNAVWQDGEPVTAADVEFTAKLESDPAINAKRRSFLKYFAGTDASGTEESADSIQVKALNDKQVQFTFKTSTAPDVILSIFNRYFYIVPKHIFENKTADEVNSAKLWESPVGSGPYQFQSAIMGERVELTANKQYYLNKPAVDKLVIRVVSSTNLLAGLISGEVDIADGSLPVEDWKEAKNYDNLVVESNPTYRYTYMAMNTQQPYLTQSVRQAISLAINRDNLVNIILQGEGKALAGPLTPDHKYFNEALLPIKYDVEQAKKVLAEEGWDKSRELSFLATAGNSGSQKTAELIQQDLDAVGIKSKIQTVDYPTLLDSMRKGEADLAIIASAGSVDPIESVNLVNPGATSNFTNVTDPTLANTALEGTTKLTFEERKPYYDKYQLLLQEQMPMAYLYSSNALTAYNKRLKNVKVINFSQINWDTWNWEIQ